MLTSGSTRLLFKIRLIALQSEVNNVGRALDSTDTSSIDLGHSHVALLTPGSSPRVSHDPVALVSIASISDDTDSMVESSSTSRVVEDTGMVSGEHTSIGFDEDRNGLLGDSLLHSTDAVGSDHLVGGSLDSSTSSVVSASSVFSSVRVGAFSHKVVLGCVVERLFLPASIATVVGSVTVNKLLFSKLQKSA